ncbi:MULTISPECIES: GNAT family N-acetyltransferase [Cellulosimicrobium]|uniref:GNAT family N-acetyltransferase n=1 Tax=Cellulosimicrobium TaxID=157920 RepID=UPI001FD32767|nr:GNAT family N-acetyltransferase [Cellulosimicrobium cellulans]
MRDEVLQVEVGNADDIAAAQGLIDAARKWLDARSIDQWQDDIPDAVIRADVDRGDLYVVRDGSKLAAMIVLCESDRETWGDDDEPAVYVHRLAVAQHRRGAGLGRRLLQWARDQAVKRGRPLVRLDCAAHNPGLRGFYEREGFVHVRDVVVAAPDGSRLLASSLYQRTATGA